MSGDGAASYRARGCGTVGLQRVHDRRLGRGGPDTTFGPDLGLLEKYARDHPEDIVRRWVARECVQSIVENEPKLTTKADEIGQAQLGLLVVALFLVAAAAAQMVS
jgi:hypothetical protein